MCNFLFLALFTLFLPFFPPHYFVTIMNTCWSFLYVYDVSSLYSFSIAISPAHSCFAFAAFHRSAILRLLLLLCFCLRRCVFFSLFSFAFKRRTYYNGRAENFRVFFFRLCSAQLCAVHFIVLNFSFLFLSFSFTFLVVTYYLLFFSIKPHTFSPSSHHSK